MAQRDDFVALTWVGQLPISPANLPKTAPQGAGWPAFAAFKN
jgi:hypothetical protein